MKKRTFYMHTLDGLPAAFFDGRSVCFTHKRVLLVPSLRQIRREQATSKRNDDARSGPFIYGYATVRLP